MNEQESIEAQGNNQQKKKGLIKHFNWQEFLKDCKADLTPAFSPKTFNCLPFPNGTLSYIGARTGRGKTMALVSLANEALEKGGRRVLFYSLEESITAITRRLMLCNAYFANLEHREKIEQIKEHNPLVLLNKTIANREEHNLLQAAVEQIKALIVAGKLDIRKPYKASLETITDDIEELAREGDIVLIDYIQKMPADVDGANRTDLQRIAAASGKLAEISIEKKCVIIAAAQVNREGGKAEEITESDFRGCGDIEQDGHNLIAIDYKEDSNGKDKGKERKFFFKILKARRDQAGGKISLLFKGAYSFIQAMPEKQTEQPAAKKKYGKIPFDK